MTKRLITECDHCNEEIPINPEEPGQRCVKLEMGKTEWDFHLECLTAWILDLPDEDTTATRSARPQRTT